MEDFLDQDTMDFVQLWDYVQGSKHLSRCISPEDVVLLDELVAGQNFSIALGECFVSIWPVATVGNFLVELFGPQG
jgi:hypothetical protein